MAGLSRFVELTQLLDYRARISIKSGTYTVNYEHELAPCCLLFVLRPAIVWAGVNARGVSSRK